MYILALINILVITPSIHVYIIHLLPFLPSYVMHVGVEVFDPLGGTCMGGLLNVASCINVFGLQETGLIDPVSYFPWTALLYPACFRFP